MPTSSLFLRSSTTLLSFLSLVSEPVFAQSSSIYYSLDQKYEGASFFDGWNFIDYADPSHGYVTYLGQNDAKASSLISSGDGQSAFMRADSSTTIQAPASIDDYYNRNGVGRKSIRIETYKSWTHALIVADIKHMPTTLTSAGCGTWPAFWTLGSGQWPFNGELDIIEGVNAQTGVFASGHTGNSCNVQSSSAFSGVVEHDDCNLFGTNPFGPGQNPTGCTIKDHSSASYGPGFNANGGGIYAMEWTSDYIKTFFFPRGQIPADLASDHPDPSTWGTPLGMFAGSNCNMDNMFKDHRIIFDTTFCGDFGEATWDVSCSASTGFSSCASYVALNPQQFSEAYWEIGSLRVFTPGVVPTTTSTTTTSTTTTTTTTTSTTTTTTSTTTSTFSTTTTTTTTFSSSDTTSASTSTTDPSATTTTPPFSTTTGTSTTNNGISPTSLVTTSASASTSTTTPFLFTTTTSKSQSQATTSSTPGFSQSPIGFTTSSSTSSASTTTTTFTLHPIRTTTSSTPNPSPSTTTVGGNGSAGWDDWRSSTTTTTTTPWIEPAKPSSSNDVNWDDWHSSTTTTTTTLSPGWNEWESTTTDNAQPTQSWLSTTEPSSNPSVVWEDWQSASSPPQSASQSKQTWATIPDQPHSANTNSVSWQDWMSPTATATSVVTWTVAPVPVSSSSFAAEGWGSEKQSPSAVPTGYSVTTGEGAGFWGVSLGPASLSTVVGLSSGAWGGVLSGSASPSTIPGGGGAWGSSGGVDSKSWSTPVAPISTTSAVSTWAASSSAAPLGSGAEVSGWGTWSASSSLASNVASAVAGSSTGAWNAASPNVNSNNSPIASSVNNGWSTTGGMPAQWTGAATGRRSVMSFSIAICTVFTAVVGLLL